LAKFTAHRFKKHLLQTNQLHLYKSDKDDRAFQFWKRDPLAIPVSSEKIFISKLEYIHNNPVKWNLCTYPEEYKWSSARFIGNVLIGLICLLIIKSSWLMLTKIILLYDYG